MPKRLTPNGEASTPTEPNFGSGASLRAEAEAAARVAAAQQAPAPSGSKFIRNVRAIKVSTRLSTGRRIELEPRGMRGDLAPVTTEEMNDAGILLNYGILFEVITSQEARTVIEKQATNQMPQGPTLMDHITNAKGEHYEQEDVHIDPSFEQQGFVVAKLSPDQGTGGGRFGNQQEVNPQGAVTPVLSAAGPQRVEVPGSIGHRTAQMPNPGTPSAANMTPEDVALFKEFMEFKRMVAENNTPDPQSVTMEPTQVYEAPEEDESGE